MRSAFILTCAFIRERGLLARSIFTQVAAATAVYDKLLQEAAAIETVINSKLPEVGERIYRISKNNSDEESRVASSFSDILINQSVAHEIAASQILALLLQHDRNNANIETAVDIVEVCANKIQETLAHGFRAIIERFRDILH